jgi:hypothetical protein
VKEARNVLWQCRAKDAPSVSLDDLKLPWSSLRIFAEIKICLQPRNSKFTENGNFRFHLFSMFSLEKIGI